jgi:hypothetical protein
VQQPVWVLLSIFPELTDAGEVVEIIGCFTDIRYVLAHDSKASMASWEPYPFTCNGSIAFKTVRDFLHTNSMWRPQVIAALALA